MNPNPSGHRPSRPIDPSHLHPQRRVFDVAPPGRTPASSTSRPIAPNHKPMVQDMSMRVPGMNGPRPMLNPHPKLQTVAPNGMDAAMPQPVAPPSPQHIQAQRIEPPTMLSQGAPLPAMQPVAAPVPGTPRPASPQLRPAVPQPSVHPAAFTPQPQTTQPGPGIADDLALDVAKVDPIQLNDDEPVLISKHMPKDVSTKWRWIIIASVAFLFLLVILDILLDADFITLRQVPHTHFF